MPKHILIGIGMWLAIIMWFNVWFIIWPNQQKALNIDNKLSRPRRRRESGGGQDGDAVLAHQHVPVGADAGGDDGREHAVLGIWRYGECDWSARAVTARAFCVRTPMDEALDDLVRRVDEDRWLASRFAPADVRARLIALYAVNYEIARTAEVVREPGVGDIRLAWWRDALAEI